MWRSLLCKLGEFYEVDGRIEEALATTREALETIVCMGLGVLPTPPKQSDCSGLPIEKRTSWIQRAIRGGPRFSALRSEGLWNAKESSVCAVGLPDLSSRLFFARRKGRNGAHQEDAGWRNKAMKEMARNDFFYRLKSRGNETCPIPGIAFYMVSVASRDSQNCLL